MSVYDRQIASAARIIAAKGQAVTWRKPSPVVSDAAKPWKRTEAVSGATDYPAYVAFFPIGRVGKEFANYMKDSDVIGLAVKGLLAGNVPFTPSAQDVVIRGGAMLRVANVEEVAPDGTPIIYIVEFEA